MDIVTINHVTIKERIMKTDELYREISKQAHRIRDLETERATFRQNVRNVSCAYRNEIDRLVYKYDDIESKYNNLEQEHSQLKELYIKLGDEYRTDINNLSIKYQLVNAEVRTYQDNCKCSIGNDQQKKGTTDRMDISKRKNQINKLKRDLRSCEDSRRTEIELITSENDDLRARLKCQESALQELEIKLLKSNCELEETKSIFKGAELIIKGTKSIIEGLNDLGKKNSKIKLSAQHNRNGSEQNYKQNSVNCSRFPLQNEELSGNNNTPSKIDYMSDDSSDNTEWYSNKKCFKEDRVIKADVSKKITEIMQDEISPKIDVDETEHVEVEESNIVTDKGEGDSIVYETEIERHKGDVDKKSSKFLLSPEDNRNKNEQNCERSSFNGLSSPQLESLQNEDLDGNKNCSMSDDSSDTTEYCANKKYFKEDEAIKETSPRVDISKELTQIMQNETSPKMDIVDETELVEVEKSNIVTDKGEDDCMVYETEIEGLKGDFDKKGSSFILSPEHNTNENEQNCEQTSSNGLSSTQIESLQKKELSGNNNSSSKFDYYTSDDSSDSTEWYSNDKRLKEDNVTKETSPRPDFSKEITEIVPDEISQKIDIVNETNHVKVVESNIVTDKGQQDSTVDERKIGLKKDLDKRSSKCLLSPKSIRKENEQICKQNGFDGLSCPQLGSLQKDELSGNNTSSSKIDFMCVDSSDTTKWYSNKKYFKGDEVIKEMSPKADASKELAEMLPDEISHEIDIVNETEHVEVEKTNIVTQDSSMEEKEVEELERNLDNKSSKCLPPPQRNRNENGEICKQNGFNSFSCPQLESLQKEELRGNKNSSSKIDDMSEDSSDTTECYSNKEYFKGDEVITETSPRVDVSKEITQIMQNETSHGIVIVDETRRVESNSVTDIGDEDSTVDGSDIMSERLFNIFEDVNIPDFISELGSPRTIESEENDPRNDEFYNTTESYISKVQPVFTETEVKKHNPKICVLEMITLPASPVCGCEDKNSNSVESNISVSSEILFSSQKVKFQNECHSENQEEHCSEISSVKRIELNGRSELVKPLEQSQSKDRDHHLVIRNNFSPDSGILSSENELEDDLEISKKESLIISEKSGGHCVESDIPLANDNIFSSHNKFNLANKKVGNSVTDQILTMLQIEENQMEHNSKDDTTNENSTAINERSHKNKKGELNSSEVQKNSPQLVNQELVKENHQEIANGMGLENADMESNEHCPKDLSPPFDNTHENEVCENDQNPQSSACPQWTHKINPRKRNSLKENNSFIEKDAKFARLSQKTMNDTRIGNSITVTNNKNIHLNGSPSLFENDPKYARLSPETMNEKYIGDSKIWQSFQNKQVAEMFKKAQKPLQPKLNSVNESVSFLKNDHESARLSQETMNEKSIANSDTAANNTSTCSKVLQSPFGNKPEAEICKKAQRPKQLKCPPVERIFTNLKKMNLANKSVPNSSLFNKIDDSSMTEPQRKRRIAHKQNAVTRDEGFLSSITQNVKNKRRKTSHSRVLQASAVPPNFHSLELQQRVTNAEPPNFQNLELLQRLMIPPDHVSPQNQLQPPTHDLRHLPQSVNAYSDFDPPTEKTYILKKQKFPKSKCNKLFRKLMNYSREEKALDEICEEFSTQDAKFVAELVLDKVSYDTVDRPDTKHYPAPMMTETQRILLGFMSRLSNMTGENIFDEYLSLAKKRILFSPVLQQIEPITLLYLAICKYRRDIDTVRQLCFDGLYFMNQHAIPLFFTVLKSWSEVLPKASDSDCNMTVVGKVFVQIILTKDCNTGGYNFLPLRDMLVKYYGYPIQPWDRNEIFKEILAEYLRTPGRSADALILLYCKNMKSKEAHKMIEDYLKAIVSNTANENFKATVIILIGNIVSQFKLNEDQDYIKDIEHWLEHLRSKTASDVVQRSINLSLNRLPWLVNSTNSQ